MKRAGRFFFTIFLAVGITFSSTTAASAAETALESGIELSTEVPEEHTVSIESSDGRIAADGVFCSDDFLSPRHSEIVYTVIPNPGKQIAALTYDGENVTSQLKNGVFKAPRLVRNASLTAVYKDAPKAPDNKTYTITVTVISEENEKVVQGVKISIGNISGITDDDGKTKLENIPSGSHQVTITDKGGKLIGHTVITIDSSGGAKLTLNSDSNGNPIIKVAENTEWIASTLWLSADGRLTVKEGGVTDITPPKPSDNVPQTGESSNMTLWVLLATMSLACLVGTGVYNKKTR